MKRAKTNEEIVEEFIMLRRIDEPLDDFWKQVVKSRCENLIAELKTGRADAFAQKTQPNYLIF